MGDDARVCREQTWRAAVLAGDEAVWRLWYDETYEPLRVFVIGRMAHDLAGSNDVIQEAWMIAVRRISDFDPRKGSFVDWLRGIAGNLVRNHSRKRQTSQSAIDVMAARTEIASETKLEVETMERSARVTAALVALPRHYSDVLRAKYLEHQSVANIAQAWNQTAKAIESLLTRARLAFREEYGEDDDNDS